MNPKFRWLLHTAVEDNFPVLFTFSVGEDNFQQVVVCRLESILRKIRCGECTHEKALSWVNKKYGFTKPVTSQTENNSFPNRCGMKTGQESQRETPMRIRETIRPGVQSESRKASRHPDIQLYVPRARRSAPAPVGHTIGDSTLNSPCSVPVKTPGKQAAPKRGSNSATKTETVRKESSRTSNVVSTESVIRDGSCGGSSAATEQMTIDTTGIKLDRDKCADNKHTLTSEEHSVQSTNKNCSESSRLTIKANLNDQKFSANGNDSFEKMDLTLTLENGRTSEPTVVLEESVAENVPSKFSEQISDLSPKENTALCNAEQDNTCRFPKEDVALSNRVQDKTCSSSNLQESTAVSGSSPVVNSVPPSLPEVEIAVPSQCSKNVSSGTPSKMKVPSRKHETELDRDRTIGVSSSSLSPAAVGDSGGDSWDTLFDENGDCLQPAVMDGLKSALGKVDIRKPKIDYLVFQSPEPDLTDECYDHILELYDFPAEFKTQNLMMAFSAFKDRGFDIKWVDDTHALAIFSSPVAASEALELQNPFIKIRPVSQAISKSKNMVAKKLDYLLPSRPRPETSASLARRMITGALGVRSPVSREQRDLERRKLQAAKEIKRQVAKQKQDIWNGTVS